MAGSPALREQPSFRRDSPEPSVSPTPAIGACPELSRCVSTASAGSVYESSNMGGRDSLGSNFSTGTSVSRSSSASYSSRRSFGGHERSKPRRGYVRPQGTSFAASAQSRESVLSLGSIAHLQYYFARTGLLDGKGGRLARKRALENRSTLDLSALDISFLTPKVSGSDIDSSYASMGSSPEFHAQGLDGMLMESPTQDDEYDSEEEDELPEHMLPPTTSTYQHRRFKSNHPPTLRELKGALEKALGESAKVLEEARQKPTPPSTPTRPKSANHEPASPAQDENQGWYEIQGTHILDIMTLAIRAARLYYQAHNQPARLANIKSERKIRAELLSVMEVLRRMATRHFARGMRTAERVTMENWVLGVYDMLSQEQAIEDAEKKQRASWTWLDGSSWVGGDVMREYAFMKSLDPEGDSLPVYKPMDEAGDEELPTEFLKDLSTGLRLVRLHNTIIKKSSRPFGAIEKWHTEFGKPYRSAENLRYWIKAAELRWEIILAVDVMGVVNGTDRLALKGFEDAIWKWCEKIREEITDDLRV